VEGLGLEAAGVRTTRHGVEVDQHLRTSNRNIYAVGDCCSRYKFTHAAMAMGRLAARNALDGAGRSVSSVAIPWCTYTDPEVAHVGLTRQEADAQGLAIDTHRLDLTLVERAVIEAQAEGFAASSGSQGNVTLCRV
jgi:pyruvate/2-oxoglutarate dehydrogenase complex dihydrolipoamide dehydrogenase (E3) component